MRLFQKYLWQKRKTIAIFVLFCGIFGIAFVLYQLPVMAVVYPALLCALVGLLFLTVDFTRVRYRHLELERFTSLSAAMIGELPTDDSLNGEDYQAIIRALRAETIRVGEQANAKYQDMVDYYTIWAHQIKTPIAAMRLNLQNTDSDEARALLADLSRIEQYVEMVLAFLRLDSESSDYVFREQAIDPIIRGAVKKFSSEFIGRKISLQYEPIGLTMVTDEKWLSFVLEQILSNALKYTREGGIRIYLSEPRTLCVEDTGIGIAPEDLPRIFEKGYTGYNGRTDQKASGIGLYLCRRICDNLGIGISAFSESEKGTTIMLRLEQYNLRKE